MSRTFEVEVAQTLYWLVTVEHDEEELEEATDFVHNMCMTEDLPELEDHWTFAVHEERAVKILSIDGEKWEAQKWNTFVQIRPMIRMQI